MTLAELIEAVATIAVDVRRNGGTPGEVQIVTITNRGTVKKITGFRPYDIRTDCPVLRTE